MYEKDTKKQIAKFNPQDILEVNYAAALLASRSITKPLQKT